MKKYNLFELMKVYAPIGEEKFNEIEYPESDYEKERVNRAKREFPGAAEKLNEMIKTIEGRSKVRTITAENICEALYYIEVKMHHITKKAMNGTKVSVNLNAQEFAGSYRFDPFSTWFTAEFEKNHWAITEIKRDICGRHKYFVELSDTAKEAVLKYYDQFD